MILHFAHVGVRRTSDSDRRAVVSRGTAYAARLDALYGNEAWRMIMAARDDDVLTGAQTQRELVNLMRWQLEKQLGYATTLPLQVRNTTDRQIFSLIFATDHPVGGKIMRSLFEGADNRLDQMVAQAKIDKQLAKDAASGQGSLFDDDPSVNTAGLHHGERPPEAPPVRPFDYARLWLRDRKDD